VSPDCKERKKRKKKKLSYPFHFLSLSVIPLVMSLLSRYMQHGADHLLSLFRKQSCKITLKVITLFSFLSFHKLSYSNFMETELAQAVDVMTG